MQAKKAKREKNVKIKSRVSKFFIVYLELFSVPEMVIVSHAGVYLTTVSINYFTNSYLSIARRV